MFLFDILWLLIPAGAANMSAVIAAKLFPSLHTPVDFGRTFRGKRILGSNKTWRGVIVGTLVGGVVYLIQYTVVDSFNLSQFQISNFKFQIYLGFILGFGALLGDMVKSFFKRQLNIPPGKSWIPFDQIDWILGSLLLITPFTEVTIQNAFFAAAIGFVAHVIVKFLGYLLNIDKTPI